MELSDDAKEAVRVLGAAINKAIEKSGRVGEAIERLREIGFEPQLTLKLEVGLLEITNNFEELSANAELDLTEVFTSVDNEHAASIGVMEKAGMKFKRFEFDENGSFSVYSIERDFFSA